MTGSPGSTKDDPVILKLKGTLLGTPNREPQEYSRYIIGIYLPGSLYSIIFLLYSWGSLFGVPSRVPLKLSCRDSEAAEKSATPQTRAKRAAERLGSGFKLYPRPKSMYNHVVGLRAIISPTFGVQVVVGEIPSKAGCWISSQTLAPPNSKVSKTLGPFLGVSFGSFPSAVTVTAVGNRVYNSRCMKGLSGQLL